MIDTQNGDIGDVACRVHGELLECEGDNRGYAKPKAVDIWGCNSGPFAIKEGDNEVHKPVVPRLCAAFQRTTLLLETGQRQPGPDTSLYYTADPTNHYSRIVHLREADNRGYTFAYDDVDLDGSGDQAGLVNSPNPEFLKFYVGGSA